MFVKQEDKARHRSASHLQDTKKSFNKNCQVFDNTHSIYYKKDCVINRFCVIMRKRKARRRSASHLRDTKKIILTKIAKYWIMDMLYLMKKLCVK